MRSFSGTGRRRSAVLVMVAGLGLATFVAPESGSAALDRGSSPTQDHPTGLKAEYDEIIGLEADLVQRLQQLTADRERMTGELTELEADLTAEKTELLEAQNSLKSAENLEFVQAVLLIEAEEEVVVAKERLRRQVVASFVSGGDNMSAMGEVLQAESPEVAERAMAYSRAVVGDTDQLVAELETAETKRNEASEAATEAKTTAADVRNSVFSGVAFIDQARDDKAKLVFEVGLTQLAEAEQLRDVQGRKVLVEGRINAMQSISDGVSTLLAARQQGQPPYIPSEIATSNPVPGYRIGSKFGMRHHPILNISRLHAGGDMGAPSGTPIYAAADGVVVLASERGGYGNCTVIDHGHSLATLYGHQSSIVVQAGQTVKRGDLIGYVGSTGMSTGPHLHFETRVKGMPIDPTGVVDFEAPVDYGNGN